MPQWPSRTRDGTGRDETVQAVGRPSRLLRGQGAEARAQSERACHGSRRGRADAACSSHACRNSRRRGPEEPLGACSTGCRDRAQRDVPLGHMPNTQRCVEPRGGRNTSCTYRGRGRAPRLHRKRSGGPESHERRTHAGSAHIFRGPHRREACHSGRRSQSCPDDTDRSTSRRGLCCDAGGALRTQRILGPEAGTASCSSEGTDRVPGAVRWRRSQHTPPLAVAVYSACTRDRHRRRRCSSPSRTSHIFASVSRDGNGGRSTVCTTHAHG